MHTPHSNSDGGKVRRSVFPLRFATDDPVGAIPDLQMVIHDFGRNRTRQQKRQEKKRPEHPPEQPQVQKSPDSEHQVDDYA